uniref:anthranilate synthase component 2 n=1 Tax=Tsunamia transpacifica TaxID=1935457 RepID=UPI001BEF8D9C|nr:anthranilate synthase component 2 [Tsunamia transpacifica]QUE27891.1 trpG [Tsunamia transpacifica]UNJ14407.1 anthranilate synthase component 2 [Tsunamia transpacifica]
MILIIDNYDSFTYNLVQYVGELGFSVKVYRNDEVSLEHLCALKPEKIIISPGPGKPEDSKITLDVIKYFSATTPILGVCLGHQSIGYLLGAQVSKSSYLMHGKTSSIFHEMDTIFKGVPSPFIATRYHSLIINNLDLPQDINVIAWTADHIIMGIRHKKYPHVVGIQFHPESLWTTAGKQVLFNFLS